MEQWPNNRHCRKFNSKYVHPHGDRCHRANGDNYSICYPTCSVVSEYLDDGGFLQRRHQRYGYGHPRGRHIALHVPVDGRANDGYGDGFGCRYLHGDGDG